MSLVGDRSSPLSRAPRSPSRAPNGARRPSAPPAGLAARDSRLRPPLCSPSWRDPGFAPYKGAQSWGAGRGRLRFGRDAAALRNPQPRHGVPLPLACPQLPAAPSSHPTTPIKVHFGRESGLRLPFAPPSGSIHFAPRELSDPGG